MTIHQDIHTYNQQLSAADAEICQLLARTIEDNLPGSTSKLWHGSPVWFLNDNPIVGYDKLKDAVRLLFWSGQSFNEPGLEPEGNFKAAEIHYTDLDQVNQADIVAWLQNASTIQWDYKNIVKRKGKLERL